MKPDLNALASHPQFDPKWEDLFDLNQVLSCWIFLEDHADFFFSAQDQERILERHVVEGLQFVAALTTASFWKEQMHLCDAGSGPGLPGLWFACLRKSPQVTLVDSSRRKIGHLETALNNRVLVFPRLKIRIERIDAIRPTFDSIVARALAPFPLILELLSAALKPKGWLALPVGKIQPESAAFLQKACGLGPLQTITPAAWKEGERKIVLCQKIGPSQKGYPRDWKFIKADIARLRTEAAEEK